MNKHLKYCRLIICFLLAMFLLHSCGKNNQPTYMPITDQILKDAVTVKVGSYFIYQDSATGKLDSFNVTDFLQYDLPISYDNTTNESLSYRAECTNNNTGQCKNFAIGALRNRIGFGYHYDNMNLEALLMKLPFASGSQQSYYEGPKAGTATSLRHYDSYSVLGRYYNDIYEMKSDYFNQIGLYNIELHTWFSTSSGLIKFSISDSSRRFSYSLIRSKIIK